MTMSVLEAIKIVSDGKAEDYINRFVGIVKFAAATGAPAPFEFDDAMVVAIVLTRLSDSAEGRKLLGLPKRKNTQLKAKDFPSNSAQSRIADEFRLGKIDRKEAEARLSESIDTSPDLRTAGRLLDDLVDRNTRLRASTDLELEVMGADNEIPGSRSVAILNMMRNIAGEQAPEILRRNIELSNEPPENKRRLMELMDEILHDSEGAKSAK